MSTVRARPWRRLSCRRLRHLRKRDPRRKRLRWSDFLNPREAERTASSLGVYFIRRLVVHFLYMSGSNELDPYPPSLPYDWMAIHQQQTVCRDFKVLVSYRVERVRKRPACTSVLSLEGC